MGCRNSLQEGLRKHCYKEKGKTGTSCKHSKFDPSQQQDGVKQVMLSGSVWYKGELIYPWGSWGFLSLLVVLSSPIPNNQSMQSGHIPGQMWPVCNNHCQPTHCWLSSVDKDTPGVTNHREGPWMIWSMEQGSAYRAGPMTLGRWKSDVGAQRWVHGCTSVTIALKGNLTFRAWLLSPVTPGGLGNHFVNPGHLGKNLWLLLLSGHPGPPGLQLLRMPRMAYTSPKCKTN